MSLALTAPWRLVEDGAASGPHNMGVDEALLASAQASGRATLRLYRWDGPWLSLGYGQKLSPERAEACRRAGVGVVRRRTGGLAVLHGADLTYTVAAPEAALPPGLQGSYCLVADALCEAFAQLGVEVERTPACRPASGAGRRAGFDCFAVPAPDELLAGGRKLAGSAQRRSRGAVLQHGSIRLTPDRPEAAAAAGLDPGRATSVLELGGNPDPARVGAAVVAGFAAVLGPLGVSLVKARCERRPGLPEITALPASRRPCAAPMSSAGRVPSPRHEPVWTGRGGRNPWL
ncbi:MAG: lipoate--protein ligase family protein [Deltaproteobacteria bacterium]|nr:lipoate--protein ligase family protein [Deltaproteobacteria bacterium]